MNMNRVTKKSGTGCVQLLLAGTIAGSLLQVPVVHAESVGTAPPPPPGPYATGAPGEQARFRPDGGIDSAESAYPPGMPQGFQDNKHRRLNRQEFMDRQEQRRKQMEQEFNAREAEMQGRIDEMQKRMDQMAAEGAAGPGGPAAGGAPAMSQPMPDPEMQKQWEKHKAEQGKRWQQQRAEQDKRREQHRAEQDKRRAQMQAAQEQRIKSSYRPESPAATAPQAASAPAQAPAAAPTQAPAAPTAPAYGYGQPVRPPAYGYGYPPPPYGYAAPRHGAPAWGGRYSPYPAAPAAGAQNQ